MAGSTGVWQPTHCADCHEPTTFFMYLPSKSGGFTWYRPVCVGCYRKAGKGAE